MSVGSVLSGLMKGKVLVTTIVGATLLVGGGTAFAAVTPAGQTLVQHITGAQATVTPTHQADDTKDPKASPTACGMNEKDDSNQANDSDPSAKATPTSDSDKNATDAKATPTADPCKEQDDKDNSKPCPGQPEAQQLATEFSLSTDSKSSSIQAICSLHDGTFKGTVDGKSVTIDHALGYGEIEHLLTAAQSLAKKANATLSDSNVLMYVATALKNCGSTPVEACIDANGPDNHSNGSNNSNGHDSAKPTVTPTPHGGDGKPTGMSTPHAN